MPSTTRHFVLGYRDLQIAVDHKPLLKLFGDRSLEDISNTRLRNLTPQFEGEDTTLPIPDGVYPWREKPCTPVMHSHTTLPESASLPASSCKTTTTPWPPHASQPHPPRPAASKIFPSLCAAILDTPITWEDLQIATAADTNLQDLSDVIEDGPPDARHHLPAGIRDYFPFIHDLSSVDGVICRGKRIVIPTQLRQTCLNALHAAHQGTSGMTARAQTSLFWPGISRDIAETRSKCTTCNSNAPSQPAMPSTTPADPEYPFQHICADF